MNSIVRLNFKEKIVEFHTCGSHEQYTESTEKHRHAFSSQSKLNLREADGWRDGREEEEEWLVTFGTMLATTILWVTWYFLLPLIT